jgi:hypothetical protein
MRQSRAITQIEPLLQQRERSRHQFLRRLAELTVKLRMAVCIHATLKCLRRNRSIKELGGDS